MSVEHFRGVHLILDGGSYEWLGCATVAPFLGFRAGRVFDGAPLKNACCVDEGGEKSAGHLLAHAGVSGDFDDAVDPQSTGGREDAEHVVGGFRCALWPAFAVL